jgi:hypothetical protein
MGDGPGIGESDGPGPGIIEGPDIGLAVGAGSGVATPGFGGGPPMACPALAMPGFGNGSDAPGIVVAGPGPDPLAAGAPGAHLPAGGSGADGSPGDLTGGIPGSRGELGPSVRAWARASLIASPDVLAFIGGPASPLGAAGPRTAGR